MARLPYFQAAQAQGGFGDVAPLPLHRPHGIALVSKILLTAVQQNLGLGEEPLYDDRVHGQILTRGRITRHSYPRAGACQPLTALESAGASSRSFMP